MIRTVSVARQGQLSKTSGENNWVEDEFKIFEAEKNTSLDIQFIKRKSPVVKNNNVVVSVRNQYGELLPFFVIPIGGVPKYKYAVGGKRLKNNNFSHAHKNPNPHISHTGLLLCRKRFCTGVQDT